jgi:hypothetical protein
MPKSRLERCDGCGQYRVVELVTLARGQFYYCTSCQEAAEHDDRPECQPDFMRVYYGLDL